jgi:hypothetical protein
MNKIWCIVCFFAVLSVPVSRAATSEELSIKLVDAMNYCSMLDRTLNEMKDAQIKQIKGLGPRAGGDVTKDIDRTYELIAEVLDCDSMKKETAAIYANLFSADELQGLIDFYESDLGNKFNEKQPELMRRSMELSMGRMQKAMPMIMKQVQQEKRDALKKPGADAVPAANPEPASKE